MPSRPILPHGPVEKIGRAFGQLGVGEWQERMHFHASGQTVGNRGQCHQVGGARQQKTARPAVVVDGELDRHQQFRRPLNLVDDERVMVADEADRVGFCGSQKGRVVEGEIHPVSHELPGERLFCRIVAGH
jgi:hypothetical protein